MDSPRSGDIKLLVELEPRRHAFAETVRAALRSTPMPSDADLGPWRDVFVRQPTPWARFAQSGVLHAGAIALLWMVSIAWLRQQPLVKKDFDRVSVLTYSPEEYLPPLDTGPAAPARRQAGDPVYAKQPIISVPREADNRSQTIVTPPDVRLNRDVPLPNIVATGRVVPAVPLEATRMTMARMTMPDQAVVAPTPELNAARGRAMQDPLNTNVIAPPPSVNVERPRTITGAEIAVIAPPPQLPSSARSASSTINVGPSAIINPAPQLAVAEQRTLSSTSREALLGNGSQPIAPPPTLNAVRGGSSSGAKSQGLLLNGTAQPIAPPPSVNSMHGTRNTGGQLVALGINPVSPKGPIVPPSGNRRGTFAATPGGKPGATGTPNQTGLTSAQPSGNGGDGSGRTHGASSLPGGLHVGAVEHAPTGSAASEGNKDDSPREMASATPPRVGNAKPAAPVAPEKVTEVDREVFGEKRFYSMTSNLPNLNSVTGSWVIRYAELKGAQAGQLIAPDAKQQSDPGYPLELMRENVHGTVTLYAVIHSDGTVGDIRVLNSPDERLDAFATSALGRWKFRPAMKDGKAVAVEAVVLIPFRVRKGF